MASNELNRSKFINLIKSDLIRSKIIGNQKGAISTLEILKLPIYSQFRLTVLIRSATNKTVVLNKIAKLLLRFFYKIEIGANVKIGHSVFFPHPMCIVIGDDSTIGDEVSIAQFSTIGGNFRKIKTRNGSTQKLPIIGNKVIIGPGAVIGGPVIIGSNVIIGANSVITKDIPSNCIAYGTSKLSKNRIEVDPTGAYSIISDVAHTETHNKNGTQQ